MILRSESPADHRAIRALTKAAFAGAPHASGTEHAIIDGLRDGGQLTLSLVLQSAEGIAGHIAFSPVLIGGQACGWFGLGPLSVAPHHQGQGHGGRLVREGLSRMVRNHGARGCVVLGDPDYYGRFGFAPAPGLTLADVLPEYFLQITLDGATPQGDVSYHPAFTGA
jgi:putative acetyltransferase